MDSRLRLNALKEEFRGRAFSSAESRYAREASHLSQAQLQVLCMQRRLTGNRYAREVSEATACGDKVSAVRSRVLAEDAQAQVQAIEKELISRSAASLAFA